MSKNLLLVISIALSLGVIGGRIIWIQLDKNACEARGGQFNEVREYYFQRWPTYSCDVPSKTNGQ